MKKYLSLCIFTILLAMTSLFFPPPSLASEGGGSIYLQGTNNDFAAGVIGPAGFYLRNDLFLYDADVGIRPLGGRIAGSAEQTLWLNLLKISAVTDLKFFGGTFVAVAAFPYALDVDVEGEVDFMGYSIFRQGTTHGLGDPYIMPAALNWTQGKHHYTAGLAVRVPLGKYDINNLLNIGRNYWALNPQVSYTYLDKEKGWDLSFTAAILFNFENDDTNYTTGDEFYLDFNLARHLSQRFGIGLTGYWYEQISDDKGDLPLFLQSRNGFRSRGIGLGPALTYSVTINNHSFNLIGKWIHDVETKNRFDGDIFMFSIATAL